jgi:ubiquitin-activating enzyme E1
MTTSDHTQSNNVDLDYNLYNRQLYVLGPDAMKRMQQSNVAIIGLTGLGVEIAKNVILTGVKSVTLYDEELVQYSDLSSQFYLSEQHIGKNRADCCVNHLKELNQYVSVSVYHGELTDEVLSTFNVVVFADHSIPQLVDKNEHCRRNNVKFIAAESRGLFGSVFTDFGDEFVVYDEDGESPVVNIVTNITNDNPGIVSVHDDKPTHGLYDGDTVVFEGVEGMDELNKIGPIPIKSTGKHTFAICDTTTFKPYAGSGYVKQVKQPKKFQYESLATQLEKPIILDYDYAKLGRPQQLHAFLRALSEFRTKHNNQLPRPYNDQDAQEVVELAKKYVDSNTTLDEELVRTLAYGSRGNLSPMAAFLGGIAAQEVQKATSGKFTPLKQWLHFESVECVPQSAKPTEEEAAAQGSRYDGQIAVFGKKFQEKLLKLNNFIVGSGALGCEYLKNFAMMGIACGGGKVTITDMDNIEVSNLNRQFLFRRQHIGKQKSVVAAEVSKEMNPNFNVVALQDKVAPETEAVFDDEFWESLDGVTNALDNVQARLYVDSRCIYYRKPLLEAGTLGTKGNVQVIIPHLTESYASTRDPPEKEIPICTLKNFPNAIEHCIQWARDLFEGLFNKTPADVNAYLSKPTFLQELEGTTARGTVESIYESLRTSKPNNFEDCVAWARIKFEELFNNSIQQLLHNFPLDMITSSGTPFWGGPKRPPRPLQFDPKNPTHMGFIIAAANLRAQVYGLPGYRPEQYNFEDVLSRINVPKFTPRSGVKISTDEKEQTNQESSADDEEVVKQLSSKLPKPSELAGFRLNIVEFEKDDDTNFHIDFITAASNLRAENYKIPPADAHKTKGIAGKIIPAMVTTTALITGLASLELYKLIQGIRELSAYKNAFVNIALPFVTLSEPGEPTKVKYGDKEWSLWDRFDVDEGRDITLKEFLDLFRERHKLEITMMSAGNGVIYASFSPPQKIAERMPQKVSELIRSIAKVNFLPKQRYVNIEICCTDVETDEDVDVPYVRYKFRHN